MNFINRLSYFSGGFLIGLVFLMFFLSGKRTSCSYLPSSRVKKDISRKNIKFQNLLKKEDSLILLNAIKKGNINFSKSNTSLNSNENILEEPAITKDDKIYINLKALDKITAKTSAIRLAVGEKKFFGVLEI